MRTLFCLLAFIWFAYFAVNSGDTSGDPASLAIHLEAAILFVGLALLSLAAADWAWVMRVSRKLLGGDRAGATDER